MRSRLKWPITAQHGLFHSSNEENIEAVFGSCCTRKHVQSVLNINCSGFAMDAGNKNRDSFFLLLTAYISLHKTLSYMNNQVRITRSNIAPINHALDDHHKLPNINAVVTSAAKMDRCSGHCRESEHKGNQTKLIETQEIAIRSIAILDDIT